MKKLLTISLLISYLISKLTYFSKKMEVVSKDDIKILRDLSNYLNEHIYLNHWQAFNLFHYKELDLMNHVLNYTITYFIFVFSILFILRELFIGKKKSLLKYLSKYCSIVDNNLISLSSFNIYVSYKNIKDFKSFSKKISFGPYKGSKWYDLNEDYIVWLYNNLDMRKKYLSELEKCLLNFHLKYHS